MTPAQQFAAIVQESRKRQLAHNRAAVEALESLLARTSEDLRQKLVSVPTGLRKERYRRDLLASIDETLDRFREQYKAQLDSGILEGASIAVQREADIVETLVANREGLTFEQLSAAIIERGAPIVVPGVQFGVVPQEVLERLYARTFRDGLNLSQRLYNLDRAARTELQEIVAKGVATGQSARNMAKAMAPTLEQSGVDNVRYKAMRIARTEINQAYREGHIASATDQSGNLHPWISAIGWRLSPSHPRVDICFREGTRVETVCGPVPIEDVKEGDLVRTHTGQYQPVTHLHRNTFSGSLLRLYFQVERNRTLELIVTPNHPVLTEEGWLRADALKTGYRARSLPSKLFAPYAPLSSGRIGRALRGFAGSWKSRLPQSFGAGCGKSPSVELVNIEQFPTEAETVYNLEVDQDHTYFAEGISVHNCDIWASDDSDGLGEGNYEPSNVPPGHPNCLCATISILASMPEEQFISKSPQPDEVPEGQLKYYGFADAEE